MIEEVIQIMYWNCENMQQMKLIKSVNSWRETSTFHVRF